MNKLIIITAVLMVTACTQVSDVIATGPNTYLISSAACPACGGSSKAVTLALQKASSFCVQQGKQMLRKNVTKENLNLAGAEAPPWSSDAWRKIIQNSFALMALVTVM